MTRTRGKRVVAAQTRLDFAAAAELELGLERIWPGGELRALQVAGFNREGNCIACGAPFFLSSTGWPTCANGHRQWCGPLERRDAMREHRENGATR